MSKHAFDMPETLRARVTTSIKVAFEGLASARGVKPSELLRELVIKEISADPDANLPQLTTGETASRLMVRLPSGVGQALHIRAQLKGMASSRYLGALAQAHLSLLPVLGDDEIGALREANRELAAIGRNLNQIAKAINGAHHETERLQYEFMTELVETIDAERAAIRQVIRASLAQWGSEANGAE